MLLLETTVGHTLPSRVLNCSQPQWNRTSVGRIFNDGTLKVRAVNEMVDGRLLFCGK